MTERAKMRHMRAALRLAQKAKGNASPNPAVGAVLVGKNGVISKGCTQSPGGDHAEIVAIKRAESVSLSRAALFVTLEPCAKRYKGKRTPPCVDAILRAGIRAVYIGSRDPNPMVNGKGIQKLIKNGVKVETVLSEETDFFYRDYRSFVETGRPWVIAKYAMTLDGKLATAIGDSKWITSASSRVAVHELRGICDAIVIGKGTYLHDDPALTVRYGTHKGNLPLRVLLAPDFDIPRKGALFKAEGAVLVLGDAERAVNAKNWFGEKNVLGIRELPNGSLDLCEALDELGKRGIRTVLVEGGGETLTRFFEQDMVDEVYAFIAPKLIGGRDAPTAYMGKGTPFLSDAIRLEHVRMQRFENDVLVQGVIQNRARPKKRSAPSSDDGETERIV